MNHDLRTLTLSLLCTLPLAACGDDAEASADELAAANGAYPTTTANTNLHGGLYGASAPRRADVAGERDPYARANALDERPRSAGRGFGRPDEGGRSFGTDGFERRERGLDAGHDRFRQAVHEDVPLDVPLDGPGEGPDAWGGDDAWEDDGGWSDDGDGWQHAGFEEELASLEAAARRGDTYAALDLGLLHLDGEAPKADRELGLAWLAVAADAGDHDAREILREAGRELGRDAVERAKGRAKSLRGGAAPTRTEDRGDGSVGDQQARFDRAVQLFREERAGEALRAFRELADEGHANAALNVGMLTREEDPDGALGWFERAARGGDANAALEAALAHLNRTARSSDQETGIAWLFVARQAGQPDAADVLRQVERDFAPEVLERARRRSGALLAGDARSVEPRRGTPSLGGDAPGPLPDGTLRMKKTTLRDPGTNDMESHTLLVPEGWSTRGGVVWSPELKWVYVNVDMVVGAPDGREVAFLPDAAFSWFDGPNAEQFRPQVGQLTGGKVCMAPPREPADFAAQFALPRLRPEARDVRVVSVREMEQVAAEWNRTFAPIHQQNQQYNQAMGGFGGTMETKLWAPLVRLSYSEGGRRFEEDVAFVFVILLSHTDSGMGFAMSTYEWSVHNVRSARAPEGRLDAETPLLQTIKTSLRPTERWQAMVNELHRKVLAGERKAQQISLQHIQQRSKAMAKLGDELREMNRDSWEKQQASSDRLNRAFNNTIKGVDDYVMPDGTTQSLDSSFDHVYSDGFDTVLFTNDHNFDPNVGSTQNWQEVRPVDPMGGAANW